MPVFEFTSPEGKVYSVQGPDGATPQQAFEILQSKIGQPAAKADAPSSGPSVGEDLTSVAKAAPGRIVAGLAGIPGDLLHLGTQLLGDRLTQESAFGSHALSKSLGSDYEAKTEPGRLSQKVIDFAPAVIGGPETLGAKVLTRVAAPVVASEVGRQVAGPYGEVAGALVGAGAATSAANRFNAAAAARNAPPLPTVDELKAAARVGYRSPDVEAVRINPNAVDNLAATIENDLAGRGFRPNNQREVFNTVDELRGAPGPVAVADLDAARQAFRVLADEVNANGRPTANAVAARRAIGHIDDFLPNLNQADLLAGDAARANGILGPARANWGAAERADRVQTLLGNAEINAASAHSGGNIQNSIKQAFKPLLKNNAAKAVGYNAEELAALNNIVRGTWAGSAARAAGNLLGGGGGLGMLASGAVGYEAGGAPGAIAAGLAGRGLKMVGNRSTFNAVHRLDTLLRQRSPEAIRIAAQNPQLVQALPSRQVQALRILILSDAAFRNQLSQPVGQANAQ